MCFLIAFTDRTKDENLCDFHGTLVEAGTSLGISRFSERVEARNGRLPERQPRCRSRIKEQRARHYLAGDCPVFMQRRRLLCVVESDAAILRSSLLTYVTKTRHAKFSSAISFRNDIEFTGETQ